MQVKPSPMQNMRGNAVHVAPPPQGKTIAHSLIPANQHGWTMRLNHNEQ